MSYDAIARYELIRKIAKAFSPKPAFHLLARQRALSEETIKELAAFVRANYIHPPSYWETPDGRRDLHDLADGRLEDHRQTYTPWLDFDPGLSRDCVFSKSVVAPDRRPWLWRNRARK